VRSSHFHPSASDVEANPTRDRGVGHPASIASGLVLVALGLPRPAHAASWPAEGDLARPCRPTVSCTADIAAPGVFEAEVGGAYSSARQAHVGTFPLLLKQTFTPLLQIQVGSNGYTETGDSGPPPSDRYLDNVFVGPKLHLRDQGDVWPSLAVSAQASLPTFRADGYSRNDDAFFTAYASKDVAFVHIDWNVGVDVWRVNEAPSTQAFTALALSAAPWAPFGIAAEGYYYSDASPLAPRDGGVRGALSVTARSWLVADLAGDVGFYPSTRACTVLFGMTVIPAVLWRTEKRAR
jgi:Putative MetA-pathway of phenol degradation